MTDLLLVVAGLAALVVGAEMLVRGGSAIATRLGVSGLLVGLTVVSIGTSVPELAVGIDATLNDAGPLAVGNIAGTNIVNILLILGLSAAMVPLRLRRRTIRIDLPVMVISALLFWVLCLGGTLSRIDGLILLALAIGYTISVIRVDLVAQTRHAPDVVEIPRTGPVWVSAACLAGGIAIIVLGANWLVDGSVGVARDLGVGEAFIGLTIVAIGTSAPELVTTIVSTLRGERDLAIGNLIGSSVYNITLILGTTALVRPLPITDELVRIDIPLMAAVALLCIPVFITGRRVSRAEGLAFVLAYFAYLAVLIGFRT